MRRLRRLLVIVTLAAVAALGIHAVERELARSWLVLAVHPELLGELESALADQKALARLDPAAATRYRQRFARTQALRARLQVLAHSRARLLQRYELTLLVVVGVVAAGAGGVWVARSARLERRLGRLQHALGELAAGRPDVVVAEGGRDLVGRIATMVEETSRRMAHDRQRLSSLDALSAWQEAARRHAHEMRTPLAAARLELARLHESAASAPPELGAELRRRHDSLAEELARLSRFTAGFAGFAQLRQPALARHRLAALVGDFVAQLAGAWPELGLRQLAGSGADEVEVDPEGLRQVLVNLCDNAALARRDRGGRGEVTLQVRALDRWVALEVADDGPGLPHEVLARLFQPYTTTRRPGEGMGLGLAIARKILLDHGGDLELVASSPAGARFRLLLRPAPPGGTR